MKFAAVVLLACVAVASASFSANLVQHTQPALSRAFFTMRLATNNKAVPSSIQNLIDALLGNVQSVAQSLLQQAQDAIAHGQAISQNVQDLIAQFLEGAGVHVQNAVGQAHASLQTLIQGLQSLLGINSKTQLFDLASLLNAVQAQVNGYINQAQQYIQQLNLPGLLSQAINHLPAQIAGPIITALGLPKNKGWITDTLGELFGPIIDQVSTGWDSITTAMSSLLQQVLSVGSSAFSSIQAQATEFLANVHAGASHLSSQAAAQILEHIGDFQEALGNQYQEVVDALSNIVVNGN